MVALAITLVAGWLSVRYSRVRWARLQALPELRKLIDNNEYFTAFRLARSAEVYIPGDPILRDLERQFLSSTSIHTSPPGADVYVKEYTDVNSGYEYLGRSPIENARLPYGYFRWKIIKQGYETVKASSSAESGLNFTLDPIDRLPAGMVRVPGTGFQLENGSEVEIDDFLIDKYEVTNRQFKEFVDSGAYRERKYWRSSFRKNGRELSWEEAIRSFRDTTDRPGPATWEAGTYPVGQDDFPVGGVSWYEAVAYAQFVGKSLPTVHHWYQAAPSTVFSYILQFSNFARQRSRAGGKLLGHRFLWNVRYGRQRQGVVLERCA